MIWGRGVVKKDLFLSLMGPRLNHFRNIALNGSEVKILWHFTRRSLGMSDMVRKASNGLCGGLSQMGRSVHTKSWSKCLKIDPRAFFLFPSYTPIGDKFD